MATYHADVYFSILNADYVAQIVFRADCLGDDYDIQKIDLSEDLGGGKIRPVECPPWLDQLISESDDAREAMDESYAAAHEPDPDDYYDRRRDDAMMEGL